MISSEFREQLKEILLDQCQMMISDLASHTQIEKLKKTSDFKYEQQLKELNCLFEILMLVERPHISISDLIEVFLRLIPPFYQSDDIKHVSIQYEGREYTTPHSEKTPWKISLTEKINNSEFEVHVFYYNERIKFERDFEIIKETNEKVKRIFENIIRVKIIEEARKNYLRNLEEDVSIKADKLQKEIEALQNTVVNQEKIQEKLAQYQKKVEMGVLLAEIAQEILIPTTNLINSARILNIDLENPHMEGFQTKIHSFVNNIISEGDRVSQVVRDKVGIAQENANQFSINEIIDEIKSSLINDP